MIGLYGVKTIEHHPHGQTEGIYSVKKPNPRDCQKKGYLKVSGAVEIDFTKLSIGSIPYNNITPSI